MPPKASKRKAANGYRLPDPLPNGEIVTGITKQKSWRIGKSIGVGGFGEIYLCSENVNAKVNEDAPLAMKIEPHENGPLFVEMNFYIRACQAADVDAFAKGRGLRALGMPVHRGSGSHMFKGDKYRFLIMDRYGKDLQKVFQDGKKLFSSKATFNIALKVLDVLEYIHSRGYVHNDIKAQNLLMGYGRTKENDVFLVDFGLVSKYQREGVHLMYKPDARKAHDGTIEYTSRDAHIGAHGRRSDLEILAYCLVHWMSGNLPWMDCLANPTQVHARKKAHMADVPKFLETCFGENDYPVELEEFLDYTTSLEFETEPDYDLCRNIFTAGLKRRKFPLDGKIDFAAAKSPAKKVGKRGRKAPLTSEDEDEEEDSEIDMSPPKRVRATPSPKKKVTARKTPATRTPKAAATPKTKAAATPKTNAAATPKAVTAASKKKTVATKMKDSSCQTSPAFVRRAKAAKEASRRKTAASTDDEGNNSEMDSFVKKAKGAARKASAGSAAKKRVAATVTKSKRRSSSTSQEEAPPIDPAFANPTPAMKAILERRALAAAAKKNTPKRSRK